MTNKAISNATETLREQLKYVKNNPSTFSIYILNRLIAGLHNYYKVATEISKDFSFIHYKLSHCLKSNLRCIQTKTGMKTNEYIKRYGDYKRKEIFAMRTIVYPISKIKTDMPHVCNQIVNNYTGR